MAARVSAVVVLYHPELPLLAAQQVAVLEQVDELVYIDNGGGQEAVEALAAGAVDPRVSVIGRGVNVGLARALNDGLAHVRQSSAAYALLLDQDSVPEPGCVATLLRGLDVAAEVVAAGPAIRDELTGQVEHFARLRLPLNSRIDPKHPPVSEFFDVDFLITSGTLLRMDLLERAGPMDDALFVDCIDFDWSFRARSRGLRLIATFATTLSHRRGDQIHQLPGGLPLRIHSATRLYYMHRNRVRLYRRGYVPLAWKVHDIGRLVVKLALLLTFVPGRAARASAVARGLRDGLRADPGARAVTGGSA
ncbi:MAG TPA: glycosyltransferase family 2 protein [Dermatophilaceae bacterium]|nr:glycosyltransferase family 2 protein [Dermatophilaceae bacterium]